MSAYSFIVEPGGSVARYRFRGCRGAIPVERARIRIPGRTAP